MKTNDPKEWMKDYSEFLNADEARVPRELNQRVLTNIKSLLNPSAWLVLAKLLGIHFVVGFLSLGICHQFGVNPFGTTRSLSDWFMEMWGHSVCMIGCGVIFVSFSILAAGYFLSVEEIRALKRTEFLQTLALGTFSLAIFAVFGTELALSLAGLWLVGAVLGGVLATEATFRIKTARI
jgi:hypothetical protein